MLSRRERRFRLLSLISLPVLLAGTYAVIGWRDIADYVRQSELRVHENADGQSFAGASWRLDQVRLIGDGRDTKLVFPDGMRLVIVRLAAKAEGEIRDGWSQCRLTLMDDRGRRWLPLDFLTSGSISRELDPQATPVDGCDAVSRHPPAKGANALIEEKFLVPANAAPTLAAHLSFASSRPDAISFPLLLK